MSIGHKHKYQAYAAATQTVGKTRQIIMLYDGTIRFIQHAREAIREKRIEDRYHLLTKASDVVLGLQGALDFESGGDIARVLYQFYSGVQGRIFALHRSNSLEECDAIIAELKSMRDVWLEIDQSFAEKGASAPEAPPPSPAGGDEQNVTISA